MDSCPEEFHDLDQNVDNIQGSQLSPLKLLPGVEQPERQALPPYIYTPNINHSNHVCKDSRAKSCSCELF